VLEVDALLFDLDGTLVDSKGDLTQSVRWLQRRYRERLSSEREVASFIGDGVVTLVRRALPHLKNKKLLIAVEEYKAHYRAHCLDTTRAYPEVRETLYHFRHKKLAVISNKPVRATRCILEGLGFLSLFRCVLGGDSLARKKPDPEPLYRALHELGVSHPSLAVMVGDGPNDVLAGEAAGTRTCLIQTNITDPERLKILRPDFRLPHFGSLRALFQ
jgi:phosphoglycolate phosphatase